MSVQHLNITFSYVRFVGSRGRIIVQVSSEIALTARGGGADESFPSVRSSRREEDWFPSLWLVFNRLWAPRHRSIFVGFTSTTPGNLYQRSCRAVLYLALYVGDGIGFDLSAPYPQKGVARCDASGTSEGLARLLLDGLEACGE
jgi:hypothetical protein